MYVVQKINFSMETHVEVPEKSTGGGNVCGDAVGNPGTIIFRYDTAYGTKKGVPDDVWGCPR